MSNQKSHIFRLVHIRNLVNIFKYGLVTAKHPNADDNYIAIGHQGLIQDRIQHEIPLPGAGMLGEYVPFYFAGHTPMLLKIKTGNGGVQEVPQEDLCFVTCQIKSLFDSQIECVFTDRNAKLFNANFYRSPEDLEKLNWVAIGARYWNNSPLQQDQKQAEFLVRESVPRQLISHIVVYNEEVGKSVKDLAENESLDIKVIVDSNRKLYF